MFQATVKIVQRAVRAVLVDATHWRGVTTTMGVWWVTGIVTARLRVTKGVQVKLVTDGQGDVNRAKTAIGEAHAISSVAVTVQCHAFS